MDPSLARGRTAHAVPRAPKSAEPAACSALGARRANPWWTRDPKAARRPSARPCRGTERGAKVRLDVSAAAGHRCRSGRFVDGYADDPRQVGRVADNGNDAVPSPPLFVLLDL